MTCAPSDKPNTAQAKPAARPPRKPACAAVSSKAGKNWSMTILRTGKVPSVFLSEGLPTTIVIAPDGRIAAFEVGAADWSEPHVVEFLEKVAAEAR